jgi:pseudouridine synthase
MSTDGFRINKCLPSLSRRAADEAVAAGRVTVNGKVVTSAGFRVNFDDEVKLDGKKQQWQPAAKAKLMSPENEFDEQAFLYLKFWKPIGVTCTSDPKDPSNIISQGKFNILPQRVFTVGRLDRDSSGLILLTSDGRVNAGFLHRSKSKEKVYEVTVDQPITNAQLQQLRDGIVISTPVQRDRGSGNVMTARTLPCEVSRTAKNRVTMTLIEGRNRQIRRMMEALGLSVTELHRISFAGITLKGLPRPGVWKELSTDEMNVIRGALDSFTAASTPSSTRSASSLHPGGGLDEEGDD